MNIEDHCGITCSIVDDEVQFQFGEARSTVLHLIVTEEVLEKLVNISTDALRGMRAESDDREDAENKTV
ncbi:MAG: hypothetical protein ACRDQ4_10785 [Pseudonocardiaceae bacterium]